MASASDQYVKIQANQAGPFTSDANICDVILPGGSAYDLSDSYLQVWATCATTQAAAAAGEYAAVHKVQCKIVGSDITFPNAALVRNCSVESAVAGQIESMRHCDVLANLKALATRSQRTKQTYDRLKCNSLVDANGNTRNSIFQDIRKTGTVNSSQVQAPIPIRLGDCMESCDTGMYDGRKLGDLRLRFELNCPGGGSAKVEGQAMVGLDPTQYDWTQLADITDPGAAGKSVTELTTRAAGAGGGANQRWIPTLADMGYYVGMPIEVSATGTNTANLANKPTVIQAIAFDETTGVATLTVAPSLNAALANGESYAAVSVTQITQPLSMTVKFDRVELVAKRIGNPPPTSMKMQWAYRTYQNTSDQGPPGITAFSRSYTIPPNADAALICFPDAATQLFSVNRTLDSYRLAINSVDTTNRDVELGAAAANESALAYDRFTSMWSKMGYAVRDLSMNAGDSSVQSYYSPPAVAYPQAQQQTCFGCAMPQTQRDKQLGVKITTAGGGAVAGIEIFASTPRMLEY